MTAADANTVTMRATDRDGVASMLDTQADAGDEDAGQGTFTLDVLEARALAVELDPIPERPALS